MSAQIEAVERPIVSVHLGKTDADKVYAKLDDEPFVVSVPVTLLDFVLTDPLQWQDLGIYRNKADEITSVEIARGRVGASTVSVFGAGVLAKMAGRALGSTGGGDASAPNRPAETVSVAVRSRLGMRRTMGLERNLAAKRVPCNSGKIAQLEVADSSERSLLRPRGPGINPAYVKARRREVSGIF